ncbi:MAG: hypothetical protein HQL80_13205 [Magnetococcales bacterium]|nr:hypothetical protein [Magnetococcales bacterium]
MSLIALQAPENTTGRTREIYEFVDRMLGKIPHAMQLFGHNVMLMEFMNNRFTYYHGQQKELTPELMHWILYLNAQRKQCVFCIDYNKGQLLAAGIPEEVLNAAVSDPGVTPLPKKEKAMLIFALDTARDDKSATPDQIESLRKLGYSDTAIFNAVEFTAFGTFSDTLLNVFQVET